MANWINKIDALDKQLMIAWNGQGTEALDGIMIFVSSEFGWLPWYIFLTASLAYHYGWKGMTLGLLGCALSVTLTDQISVHLFKEVFERLRPCHQQGLQDMIRIVDGCGGQYGFVSSHACNTAGVATLLWKLLPGAPITRIALVFWAAIVAYSRVYLGVHFPGDVIAGSLLGIILGHIPAIALLRFRLFKNALK